MNLENRNVNINYISVNSFPPNTRVTITISREIMPGVFQNEKSFDLTYDRVFHNVDDAALLAAIHETLAIIPD